MSLDAQWRAREWLVYVLIDFAPSSYIAQKCSIYDMYTNTRTVPDIYCTLKNRKAVPSWISYLKVGAGYCAITSVDRFPDFLFRVELISVSFLLFVFVVHRCPVLYVASSKQTSSIVASPASFESDPKAAYANLSTVSDGWYRRQERRILRQRCTILAF